MSTKALIGILLAGTVGILIFLFVHLSGDSGKVAIGSKQAEACAKGGEDCLPDVNYVDTTGTAFTHEALVGKVVIVNFWATWCPPCRAEMPSMEVLHRELAGEGLVLLAVNIEKSGRETVPAFLAKNAHSFQILYDDKEEVQKRYGVYKFPESFVIRKDGVIDDKVIGAIDWADPRSIAYFRDLLKG
jgi:thiol-disulfide isomerase/thioredoxin